MGERGSWVCDVDWAVGALSVALRRAFGARFAIAPRRGPDGLQNVS